MNCDCEYCKNNLAFTLPQEVINATISGNLVVFAGAGISTESHNVFKETFYEEIFNDLKLDPSIKVDFPTLMSLFCNQTNGRQILLSKIKERFDYAQKFYELYRVASWFHNEISSIYQINKIITTNWDDYFEKECAAIPIVTAEDFAFYNIPERKVFKIHGSISNYGSIVATNEDYKKCYRKLKSGLVGAHLKTLLGTSVVLFVGFSFNDYDFNRIHNYLKKEMGEVIPHIYVVTLDATLSDKFDKSSVTTIQTDGKYFFSILRKHLEGTKKLLPKENIEKIWEILEILRSNHRLSEKHYMKNKFPCHIYNLFYQDGVRHALDNLYFFSKSGKSFNPFFIINTIDSYEKVRKEMLNLKRYGTLAYVEGYIYAFRAYFLNTNPKDFLYFFIIGFGQVSKFNEYKKVLKGNIPHHKTSEAKGFKEFKNLLHKDSTSIPNHTPFIW
jgi:NAD-dependent SIR2 family protein deacetylase